MAVTPAESARAMLGELALRMRARWRRPYGMIWPTGLLLLILVAAVNIATHSWSDLLGDSILPLVVIAYGFTRQGPKP